MNIIEEHRSKVRSGDTMFSIEVTTLPGGDQPDRLVVSISAEGPRDEVVADGQIEVASVAAGSLGSVLSATLRQHTALAQSGTRRAGERPAQRGRPWSAELDAELERRWIAGDSLEEIALHFERSPGGVRVRLPRVGCDPERPGQYLPEPPSQRRAGGESASP
ncbi:helix-turn-helix domain containing protein [Amycolatopsis sp. K13G38]|uniref:Helix-turn-helix domain containing protein n=1 Tax=Amycolatopsis acididurans TaxID=2724524 RepID=A0ABX1JKI8_9PSEU|nr:helix-turn-helix domain containing protein [Amycolatopsis acididurans]NKQ58777.1 helix-turn-helix domain containing protein [Amycolatopsis acididurans]